MQVLAVIISLSSVFISLNAHADCSSPNALIGSLDFQGGLFKYCDGSNWQSLGGTSFPLLAPSSPSGSPMYTFAAGTNTGIYSPGVGTLGLATAGGGALAINGSGNVGIGTTVFSNHLVVASSAATGTHLKIATPGTGGSQIVGLNLMSADTGGDLGTGTDKGWRVGAYADAYSTTSLQNALSISYYDGSVWATSLAIDPTTGFVRLGAGVPTQRLDVTGGVNASTSVISPLVTSQAGSGLDITAGTVATATSNGNPITIVGGSAGSTLGTGGNVTITGGTGRSGFSGGAVTLIAGSSTVGNSAGASTTIKGGSGAGSGDGGTLFLSGGDAGTTGVGGSVLIKGGLGTAGNAGGALSVIAGDGGGSSANGADVTITGGAASGTNKNGGDIFLSGGAPTGTGTIGNIRLIGKVGIGSTNPVVPLDVLGGVIAAGSQSSSLGGEVRFHETGATGFNYIAFRGPSSITNDVTWLLPTADGTLNQAVTTTGSGSLTWSSPSAGLGDFFANGSAAMTGSMLAIGGSSLAPGISFSSDLTSGLYRPALNTVGLAAGGLGVVTIAGNRVGINTTNPAATLDVTAAPGDTYAAYFRGGGWTDSLFSYKSNDCSGSPALQLVQPGTGGWNMYQEPCGFDDVIFDRNADVNDPDPVVTFGNWYIGLMVGVTAQIPGNSVYVEKGAIAAGSQSSTLGGEVRFYDLGSSGLNFVGLRGPSQIPTDSTWVLPPTDGSNGQLLQTNGAGSLTWVTNPGTVAKFDDFAQGSGQGYTTLYTAPADGFYAAHAHLETTTTSGAGNITLTMKFTDSRNNVLTTAAICTVSVTSITATSCIQPMYVKAGTNIQYSTQFNGVAGSPKYDLHVRMRSYD